MFVYAVSADTDVEGSQHGVFVYCAGSRLKCLQQESDLSPSGSDNLTLNNNISACFLSFIYVQVSAKKSNRGPFTVSYLSDENSLPKLSGGGRFVSGIRKPRE